MTDLVVHPAEKPLEGSVPVPTDKSIGHRALLFSALANGTSKISKFAGGEDNVSTANALRAMGVRIDMSEIRHSGRAPGERAGGGRDVVVHGVGIFGLKAPAAPLDCGNSGTTMRLFCGLLSAQEFASTLVGDASLSGRPMMRVVKPLSMRGAKITGKPHPKKSGDVTAPLEIAGLKEGEHLGSLEYESPVASAQVKSAILISGLYAHGATYFREPLVSRDHTERMLTALGVPLRTTGSLVELDPNGWRGVIDPLEITVPGDLSAAAFFVTAGQIIPGSRITLREVGINPTRTGILEIVRDMGGAVGIDRQHEESGEPVADLHASASDLRGARFGGEVVARAIDEIPIACALAARAHGVTEIADAGELRVKESDRIAAMARVLRAFGVSCEEVADGMTITGTQEKLKAVDVESKGDHRIAMTAAVLALIADGPSKIRDVDCVATSFPRFVGTLRALGARVDVV
ncbi:MAG: 3-phosphoshikimate 1-carboxyvinyltransferase [Polyangiaceae bacterium]